MKTMKKLFVVLIMSLFVAGVNAQNVPFVYTGTMEFSKVDDATKKELLSYANAGKYGTLTTQDFDSVTKVVMVKGVKSRSGKTEDQVWLQGVDAGKTVNLLFSLTAMPSIATTVTGRLSINGHRGDSDEMESEDDGW